MSFDYYLHNDFIFRLKKGTRFTSNVRNFEVLINNKWLYDLNKVKSLMNSYVTGWIDEDDAILSYEEASYKLLIQKYISIKDFAIESHKGQKYALYPYDFHLFQVISVLFRFGIKISNEYFNILASAWLHDILEDTDMSKNDFINRFGVDIYNIVWSLTDGKGKNRNERKADVYKKIVNSQEAIVVKLADRIANVEFSIANQDYKHLQNYFFEHDKFKDVFSENTDTDLGKEMLSYLNEIILNSSTILHYYS